MSNEDIKADDYHSPRSPSGAHRWMSCAQSVQNIPNIPTKTSIYAAEGTAAHWVMEQCLTDDLSDPHDYIGRTIKVSEFDIKITEEMADDLLPLIDAVRSWPGDRYVEKRVHLDEWAEGESGSVDTFVIWKQARTVRVNDLKYGHNQVEADFNQQMMTYALGIMNDYPETRDYETWILTIFQPRGSGSSWSEFVTTNIEILKFGEEVRAAIKETENPNAPFNPGGKTCQYCARRELLGCSAYNNWYLEQLGFEDLDAMEENPEFRKTEDMPEELKVYIYNNIPFIKKWLEQLEEEAYAQASIGRTWKGLKFVKGKAGKRIWTNEQRVERLLSFVIGENAYKKELITPAVAQKLLEPNRRKKGNAALWERLNSCGLIFQNDSSKVLVSESDLRKELASAGSVFENLENGENDD